MINLLPTISYIDPAATTALISSLTAIGVAIGATFIILWRKFKKGVNKVLHKDENAGKIVEDELVITDETIEQTAENGDAVQAESTTAPESQDAQPAEDSKESK